MAGIFFAMTGFLISFHLLKRLRQNEGTYWAHPIRIYLERYWRIVPLYFFMILFLANFLSLFGGAGPRFYEYESEHGCSETWFWHFLMFNNVFPWAENDYCIKESWYLANDMWFYTMALQQVWAFTTNRKKFYYSALFGTVFVTLIQTAQISYNDFRASYLSYQDEYWTVYYDKPYTFFHTYNIGFILGCYYFAYKMGEIEANNKIHKLFIAIKEQPYMSYISMAAGLLIQFITVTLDKIVNSRPKGIAFFPNLLYLLVCRPLYVIGFALIFLPLIL
jgi:peptidoglycan/LPS O-acetylase OafA/YrhL